MAIQARVTSSEALESFRNALIIFLNKARLNVDDAVDEVRRMKSWLQHEQMTRWEGEIRRRQKMLDQAESELRNAQFAENHSATQSRMAAVHRIKQAMSEAEDKLRRVKKWSMNYDNAADPIIKKIEGFRGVVIDDLPKAIAYLRNAQAAIEAYAEAGGPPQISSTSDTPVSANAAQAETAPTSAPSQP